MELPSDLLVTKIVWLAEAYSSVTVLLFGIESSNVQVVLLLSPREDLKTYR